MRVVVSGSSGMLGSHVVADLTARGHEVLRLVRRPTVGTPDEAFWDPASGTLDPAAVAGADAVVNLNGRNLAGRRWTRTFKNELRTSRLGSTTTLVHAMAAADPPPRLLVNASAVGYYGDRGDERLGEDASPGSGFLAELVRDWEEAAGAAATSGVRVLCLRLGMVIGRGGALASLVPVFKLGGGGPVGSGRQWWPWIAMEDVLAVVRTALEEPTLSGAVNLVSPEEVRCRDFARALGRVLRRPAVLPLPAPVARLVLGGMADEMLLASTRAHPAALAAAGYSFRVPTLESAIRRALD